MQKLELNEFIQDHKKHIKNLEMVSIQLLYKVMIFV